MHPNEAAAWYRRMSIVYAAGAWALMGSLYFFSGQKNTQPVDKVEQKDVSTKEHSEHPKGFYVETIITYREDFVPVTKKILNYLKSWTGGPPPES